MTDILTNPYNVEYREANNRTKIVVYNGRAIARVTEDGTLMTQATEVARSATMLDSLGMSKAMFLVETENQLRCVLEWPGLRHFAKLTLNLYFIPDHRWVTDLLKEMAPRMQHLEFLDITGAVPLPPLMGDEALRVFENIPQHRILGHGHLE
jgi:hypothetical protein